MTFLLHRWYAAAWNDEILAGEPLYRRILGHAVMLLRDADDTVTALPNRCPHRFAPFDRGVVKDGTIQCGYHGLEFDYAGRCIFNPHGDGKIAPNAHLKPWPLAERFGMQWIWMGDPALADPSLIPDYGNVFNPELKTIRRYLHTESNYELVADNLLDLGHTAYLHGSSLGSRAIIQSERKVKRIGDDVVYELDAPGGEAPPLFQEVMPWYRNAKVDHWMTSIWRAPGQIQQQIAFATAGANRENADILEGLHLLTPETEKSTHYFTALSRAFRKDDETVDRTLYEGGKKAFTEEDFPMVEAIQREIGDRDFWEMRPLILSVDAGAVMARRILKRKLDEERGATEAA
ncbi:aromatic ring-hydroxylating dioxygenase subunit alpha [Sphingomonas immobilis]|uniref:Aromatic ring-hydroxylating dioxygenase subunit alpha n=1 Tax=Sphingomonas immobilis TaxID=3063997 RepID=A0ABT8ZTA9_9SPHN|nr:aromatic ring-hydroxylating dioxygenase subunit alpha [Sphingomonas sp. CA1-15]MDO7840796.1 aromatic ring-hydroxylating dioxygenase subunit alpha [Sphingomonas sp. CA1-15]